MEQAEAKGTALLGLLLHSHLSPFSGNKIQSVIYVRYFYFHKISLINLHGTSGEYQKLDMSEQAKEWKLMEDIIFTCASNSTLKLGLKLAL